MTLNIMSLQFFIQGDQNNEWWHVMDKQEYDAMKRIYSFYNAYKRDYQSKDRVEYVNYQVIINNNTKDYVLELKWQMLEYFGQNHEMAYEIYRYRKNDPVKKRKITVVELPNHNGFNTLLMPK